MTDQPTPRDILTRWTCSVADAQSILDALSAAGWVLTRLPKPDIVADTYKSWHFNDGGERQSVTTPGHDDDDIGVSGIGHYTIVEARAFAAALLAAADTVEKRGA